MRFLELDLVFTTASQLLQERPFKKVHGRTLKKTYQPVNIRKSGAFFLKLRCFGPGWSGRLWGTKITRHPLPPPPPPPPPPPRPSPTHPSLVFLNEVKLDPCGNTGGGKNGPSIHKKKITNSRLTALISQSQYLRR